MALLDKIKPGIDMPSWLQVMPAATAHAAGVSWCCDKRNDIFGYDVMFQLASATVLNVYYGYTNGTATLLSPGISAFGAGSTNVYAPSFNAVGTIAAGASTTKIISSTSITAVPLNGYVFGSGFGAKIRIIGNSAGGTGVIEERMIVQNTAGATPTFYLDTALSFTPAAGDSYEIILGRVYCLGTTAGATQFRYLTLGPDTMTSAANTTLTIATDSSMLALDEQYVPYNRYSGEGFLGDAPNYYDLGALFPKRALVATATANGSITGQITGGDAGVIANEYRNFQIRVVEDTVTPTAVNQRAIIASHTALAGGPTGPVYTLGANWGVKPSANAKFVIENPNQILLFTVAASTAVYTYNYSPATQNNGTATIAANAWSSTYFGARGAAVAAGCWSLPSWQHVPRTNADGTRLTRHSYIYSFRGGAITLDMLDIAGGTAGAWTNGMAYHSQLTAFGTGTSADFAPADQEGRWGYVQLNTSQQIFRFDVSEQSLFLYTQCPVMSGTAAVGNRMCITHYDNQNVGGTDKMSKIYLQGHLSTAMFRNDVIV